MSSRVGAVVVAAGSGERLGAEVPKAMVELRGRPLVAWAVAAMLDAGVDQVVVTAPADWVERFDRAVGLQGVRVVAGGPTRSASVRLGLAALTPRPDLVAVHDAARATMPSAVIRAAIDAIGADVLAAAPGLPVVDTLKRVGPDGTSIRGTVDRSSLVAIQTPQVFTGDVLAAVHAWAGDRDATDDLGLFEAAVAAGAVQGRAVVVPGSADGGKITYLADLLEAEARLAAREGGT